MKNRKAIESLVGMNDPVEIIRHRKKKAETDALKEMDAMMKAYKQGSMAAKSFCACEMNPYSEMFSYKLWQYWEDGYSAGETEKHKVDDVV